MMNVLYNHRVFLLVVITLLAFALRFYRLDAAGLSEDESHKMEAVRAYQQGHFTINAEHPMLMKTLCTVSVGAAERWHLPIPVETALRLPNVIFGALTCLVLYLFFSEQFGFRIGLLTAILWAINLHAILINRVAKEDTLLVFFLWLAYYFFRRAKKRPESDARGKQRLYIWSGINFGLMIASKYFPHYFGLNVLYYHLLGPSRWNSRIKTRFLVLFFIAMGVTFFIANPALLMPGVIKYMTSYAQELQQTHHGYWMMNQLYRNDASNLGDAVDTPIYFYLLALVVKTPAPLLFTFVVGLYEIFRRREEEYFFLRFMLLLWIVPYSCFGAKWLRYMLSFIPIFSAIAAIGISAGYDLCRNWWARRAEFTALSRALLITVGSLVFILLPTISIINSAPFYSLYVSPLAGGDERIGYYFPHDEFYDLGLREALQYIANDAEPGAIIANDAPGVINHYRQEFGRPDLISAATSDANFRFSESVTTYVIVQDGRRYFENENLLTFVENNYAPVKEVQVRGVAAVKIYKIKGHNESVQMRPQAVNPQAVRAALVIQ